MAAGARDGASVDKRTGSFHRRMVGGLTAAAVIAGFLVWIGRVEPNRLVVTRYEVQLEQWPAALDGIRAVVLADLHVRPEDLDRLRRIVAESNALKPDVIFLLGDYVRGRHWKDTATPEAIAEALGKLTAPGGIFAVLGNHDWWQDGPRIRRALEDNRIRVLENEWCWLQLPAGKVQLVGLPDRETRQFDPGRMPEEYRPAEPGIVLSHHPDVFPELPPETKLVIAGHTHGGQVNLPWLGRLVVPSEYGQRYASGLIVEKGRTLLVSNGLGQSIAQLRFRCPPEIVELTIRRADQADR